jgi:hypothetical protein
VIVDKASGSVHMIRNDYSPTTEKFAWTDMGIVFDGGGCPNQHGVGLFDLGVRFADVTGNTNDSPSIYGISTNYYRQRLS